MNVKLVNFLDVDYKIQLETLNWRNSEHVTKYFKLQKIDIFTHEKWLESLKSKIPNTIAFFIEYENKFVGVTYFYSIDYHAHECVWGVYIYDENLRGKGIGSKILSLSIDYANSILECKKINLEVLESNFNAIKLYESFGFLKTGHKDNVLSYAKIIPPPPPRISVLMPVYKPKESHLKEAIESILSQTFTDLELIIVDDCPEDKSAEYTVKYYNDKRIKYFRNRSNLGIAGTRNRLLEISFESLSEYIAIVDHDDIQLPQKYAKMIKFLDENPEIGVVGAGFYEWWENTGEVKKNLFPEFDFLIRFYIFTGQSGLIHSSMVRKELYKKYNIKYLNKYSEQSDQMMWLDMLKYTSFYNIQEPLMKYRWHDSNTSILLKHRENEFMQSILDYIEEKYPNESRAAKLLLDRPSKNNKYKRLFNVCMFFLMTLFIFLIVMLFI